MPTDLGFRVDSDKREAEVGKGSHLCRGVIWTFRLTFVVSSSNHADADAVSVMVPAVAPGCMEWATLFNNPVSPDDKVVSNLYAALAHMPGSQVFDAVVSRRRSQRGMQTGYRSV